MSIKSILSKLFNRNVHPGHQPYIPSPTQQPPRLNQSRQNQTCEYIEVESDLHSIAGTTIAFGTKKLVQVNDGVASEQSQTQSHIIGSGKIISKAEDLGGVCRFCQAEAVEQYNAGQISLEQLELSSFYDKTSATTCHSCGFQGCLRHIRPLEIQGGIITICILCQDKLARQMRKQRVVNFLLAPFTEDDEAINQ